MWVLVTEQGSSARAAIASLRMGLSLAHDVRSGLPLSFTPSFLIPET